MSMFAFCLFICLFVFLYLFVCMSVCLRVRLFSACLFEQAQKFDRDMYLHRISIDGWLLGIKLSDMRTPFKRYWNTGFVWSRHRVRSF